VQIVSLPWLRRSALLSKEETRNLDFDQLKQKLEQVLTNIITASIARLDPTLPAILAAHVWVSGAQAGTEKQMTIGQDHALLVSNVAQPADEKGFYMVEIEPDPSTGERQVSFDFHPVSARRFLTVNVALESQDLDPTATVLQAIATQEDKVSDAIVRLNISLPTQIEGQLRDSDLREALKETHYATIARDIQRETRLRLGEFTAEELTPLAALKAYLESKNTPPERAKVLMEYGEKLIKGESTEQG